MTDLQAYELPVIRDGTAVSTWLAFSFFRQEILGSRAPDFLAEGETEVWRRYVHARRRASFVMGRHAAKKALMALWRREDTDMDSVGIGNGVFSQPIIQDSKGMTAEISLAHSDGVAIALVSTIGHPIGVDVERMVPDRADVIRSSSLSAAESERLKSLTMDEAGKLFAVWTVKEALSKILRCGLMVPFQVLEISEIRPGQSCPMECAFKNFPQYRGSVWMVGGMTMAIVLPKRSHVTFEPGDRLSSLIGDANRAYETFIPGAKPAATVPE